MTPRSLALAALSAAAFSLVMLTGASAAQAQSDDDARSRAREARELLGREDFAVPPGRDQRDERSRGQRAAQSAERRVERRLHTGRPDDRLMERPERGYNAGVDIRQLQERYDGRQVGREDGRGRHEDRFERREDRLEDRQDFGETRHVPDWDRARDRHHERADRRHERRDYRRTPNDTRYDRHRRYDRYDRYADHRRYRSYDRHHHRRYVGLRHHRQDWRYHRRYHDRYNTVGFNYYDGFCRTSGEELIVGALLGALIGGAAFEGDGAAILAGGLIGGGIGASLNDCDRSQYHYAAHYAFSNDQPGYWHNPHSGVYGVVYARDYHNYRGQRCRYGDAEVYMPNGQIAYDRVLMCLNRYGYWEVARYQ